MTPPQPPLGATPEPEPEPEPDYPECIRCNASVHLRDDTEHSGYCDNCAHVLVAELATARAALTQCEERAEQNQLAADCLGNLAKLVTNDDGIDPEAFHIELTCEEANLIKLVAEQTAKMPDQARAESAESALSLLTAKLAQCEEKLLLKEHTAEIVAMSYNRLNDGMRQIEDAVGAVIANPGLESNAVEMVQKLTAAHAKALEDGKRVREALELERVENLKLMGPKTTQFDLEMFVTKQAYRLQAALASAPATSGKE